MATNYTGNSAPTLSNAPASSWTDDAAKHSHVGNTYLVTGSGSDAGKVYSFEEYPTPLVKSASGLPKPIVTITDGGDNLNMVHAQLTLSPIQSLNGYDHPWAGGAGKNLIDGEYTTNASGSTSHITTNFAIPTTGATITASAHTADGTAVNTGNCAINFKTSGNVQLLGISPTQTKTAPDLSMAAKVEILTTAALANKKIYVQLEVGSSATEWSPYSNLCPITGHTQATLWVKPTYDPDSNPTASLSLGQTVYGGTVDLVTGEGEITHSVLTLTGSSAPENWVFQSGNNYYQFTQYVDQSIYGNATAPLSDTFQTMPLSDRGVKNGVVAYNDSGYRFCVLPDFGVTTLAEWKTWLSNHNVQLYLPLKNPIPLSLSGQQIQTLLGENNVWGDGEVSKLVYRSNQFTPAWQWFETWTMPKITRDNGQVIVLPYPQEYTPEIYDVDAATTGRNAAGTMIRDRVARKHKFNYKFPPLSQADATEILDAVQDVSFTLTTASPETGAKANYRVYVGDRSLPVYWMPNHNNASWLYSSLSLNLIEM